MRQRNEIVTFLIFLFLVLFNRTQAAPSLDFYAEKGRLDLTGEKFDEIISLDGEWEFYWQKLYTPQDFAVGTQSEPIYTRLMSWKKTTVSGQKLTSKGFATYRLVINTSKDLPLLAIRLKNAYSSARVWINGELLAEEGVVGRTEDETVHHRLNRYIPFGGNSGRIEIVIQVANFYHNRGGILDPPEIAKSDVLFSLEKTSIISSMIFIGSLGFIGISFLLLFLFLWAKDRAILYFALFCLCWAYRTMSEVYSPLITLFPGISWSWSVRIEHISLYIGAFMGSMFMNNIFNKYTHRYYPMVLNVVTGIFVLAVLLTPRDVYTIFLIPFFIFSGMNLLYIFFVIVRAFLARQKESFLAIIAIFFSILVIGTHIYVFLFGDEKYMISINIGYIAVFMLNSLILGMRFSRSFYKLEKLSVKTLEQNEEISNQARQLTLANRELNRQSKVLKERNEEIQRINETLELKVMERTAKLAAINTELDTFLYKSSHDLRRPIISILGLTYLAGKSGNGVDHEEIFQKITEMAMSMDKLIHKLGDLNEINDRELSFEEIDLPALIEKTKNDVCNQLKNPEKAIFKIDCSPVIHTDPLIFKKILYQLFLNSAIWVDHSDYLIEITCTIKQENQYQVIIEVEDNGPGIPAEFQSEVFAMYKVADERTKSHGLGLYIVDKAIRKLKGKVRMESKAQQGTRFIVELPVPVQL